MRRSWDTRPVEAPPGPVPGWRGCSIGWRRSSAMHELSGFEQVLAVALDGYAGPRRPVDAAAIARRAMAGRGGRMRPTSTWLRPNAAERRTLLRVALVA